MILLNDKYSKRQNSVKHSFRLCTDGFTHVGGACDVVLEDFLVLGEDAEHILGLWRRIEDSGYICGSEHEKRAHLRQRDISRSLGKLVFAVRNKRWTWIGLLHGG